MCVCETENTAIQICLRSQDLIVRDLVGDKSLLLAIGGTHLSIKLLSQPEFCGRGQTPEQTGVHRATRAALSSSIINFFFMIIIIISNQTLDLCFYIGKKTK